LAIAPEHFTKILHELADNAIKFSNTDTPVTVASSSDDTFYYLSISNQGRGMTNDEIENLGAFMQFDRASQEQQGAGMGLVIVKRIVALYGGKFSIESTVNELTTVTIALPIAHL
jgi:two-component system sensor histidine kinase/response regulator